MYVILCYFMSLYVIYLIYFLVSNISRHDVTINITKEMTTTVILCHFMSLRHFLFFLSFYVIVSFYADHSPYFCFIPRHDVTTNKVIVCHFLSFYVIHLSFVLFIVSNIPRHDVTINMIEEMTATVVQLQEENRYLQTFFKPHIYRNWSSVHSAMCWLI